MALSLPAQTAPTASVLEDGHGTRTKIYALGAYTGDGVKTLAGVGEAMDAHQWGIAEQESPIIGNVLEAESRAIDAAPDRLASVNRNP